MLIIDACQHCGVRARLYLAPEGFHCAACCEQQAPAGHRDADGTVHSTQPGEWLNGRRLRGNPRRLT